MGLSPWRDLFFGPTQEFESVSLRKSFIRAAIERLESANKLKFDNKEQKFLWIKDMTARVKLLLQHVSSYKWKGSKSPKWFKRLRMFGEEWETIPDDDGKDDDDGDYDIGLDVAGGDINECEGEGGEEEAREVDEIVEPGLPTGHVRLSGKSPANQLPNPGSDVGQCTRDVEYTYGYDQETNIAWRKPRGDKKKENREPAVKLYVPDGAAPTDPQIAVFEDGSEVPMPMTTCGAYTKPEPVAKRAGKRNGPSECTPMGFTMEHFQKGTCMVKMRWNAPKGKTTIRLCTLMHLVEGDSPQIIQMDIELFKGKSATEKEVAAKAWMKDVCQQYAEGKLTRDDVRKFKEDWIKEHGVARTAGGGGAAKKRPASAIAEATGEPRETKLTKTEGAQLGQESMVTPPNRPASADAAATPKDSPPVTPSPKPAPHATPPAAAVAAARAEQSRTIPAWSDSE